MAMLITTIAAIKEEASRKDSGCSAKNRASTRIATSSPKKVCVDKMDLYRYGALAAAQDLAASAQRLKRSCGM